MWNVIGSNRVECIRRDEKNTGGGWYHLKREARWAFSERSKIAAKFKEIDC